MGKNNIYSYRAMKIYSLLQLTYKISYGIFISLFVTYVLGKGLSFYEVSILSATFSIAIVLMELPTGIIGDYYGKLLCMKLSYFLMSLAFALYYFGSNMITFLIGQVMMAIAATLTSGIIESWLFDELELEGFKDSNAIVTNQIGILNNVGLTIGVFLGGIVGTYNIKLTMLISSFTMLIPFFISMYGIKSDKVDHFEKSNIFKNAKQGLKMSSKNAKFLLLSLSMSFIAFAINSPLNNHWQPFF